MPRSLLALSLSLTAGLAQTFVPHTVATGLRGGYQVVVADLNHDGKPDLIALASGMSELVWYENPTWTRHVIAGGFHGMINCAARDLDGDGIPEIVLASGFRGPGVLPENGNTGILTFLSHQGDPRRPWKATEIGRLPASHRLRWFTIGGQPLLLDVPLTASRATAPQFQGNDPITVFRPGSWQREIVSMEETGVVHGVYITPWHNPNTDDVLIAGFRGISWYQPRSHGRWKRHPITPGDPTPWPHGGSSDVTAGHLGGKRFLCAIEPWHGNQVAVYREQTHWRREVLDSSLSDGHTILTADLDGSHNDMIVAGFRGGAESVYLYRPTDSTGAHWRRQTLDNGGMGAAACAIADFNGDGRLDIACIGSPTANLKWYENRPAAR
jgi:hypothetical protein